MGRKLVVEELEQRIAPSVLLPGIVPRADTTPPTVDNLVPAPGATVTAPPSQLLATFSENISPATLTTSTFVLEASGGDGTFGDGNEIAISASSITYDPGTFTATFNISGLLTDETYQVTLDDAITDLAGNPLDGEYLGAFPSGDGAAGGDFVSTFILVDAPPTVIAITPNVNALLTTAPTTIDVSFSENINVSTLDATSFLLVADGPDATFGTPDDISITATSITYNPLTYIATFTVAAPLPDDTYQVTLTDSVTDLAGIALDGEYIPASWPPSGDGTAGGDFAVTFVVLDTLPTVTGVTPTPASLLTVPPATIVVTFSENMDLTTVQNPANISLVGSGIDGTFGTGDDVVMTTNFFTYDPVTYTATWNIVGIPYDDTYQITLADAIVDLGGRPLDGDYDPLTFPPSGDALPGGDFVVTFDLDGPPMVIDVTPAPGSTTSAPTSVVITLSEGVQGASINPTSFLLEASGGDGTFGDGNEVPIASTTVIYDPVTYTAVFSLAQPLAAETYQVTLTDSVLDLSGNPLDGEYAAAVFPPSGNRVPGGDFRCTFVVDPAPTVTAVTPAPGSNVGSPILITATLSEDVLGVGASTFLLEGSGGDDTFGDGNEVPITAAFITYDPGNPAADPPIPPTATFWVSGTLAEDTYQVTLTDAITDAVGNPLDGEFVATFPSGDGVAGGDFHCTFMVSVAPQVIWITPLPAASLGTSPTWLVATFSEELVGGSINPLTFTLLASGDDDGTFDDGNEIAYFPISVSYSYDAGTGASTATFVVAATLPPETYQISLTDLIVDLDGNPLDGEYSLANFPPSGDGDPGGVFRCEFIIEEVFTGSIVLANTSWTWTDSNDDLVEIWYLRPGRYPPDDPPYLELWSPYPQTPLVDGDDIGYLYIVNSNDLSEVEIHVVGGSGPLDIPIGRIITADLEKPADRDEPPEFDDEDIAANDLNMLNIGVGFGPTPLAYGTVHEVIIGGNLEKMLLGGTFWGGDLIQTGGDNMDFLYIGGDLWGGPGNIAQIAVGGEEGAGNLDFLFVEGDTSWEYIFLYDPLTFTDDSGGLIDIQVGDRQSYIQHILLIGGGGVITELYIASPYTGVNITTSGEGGDIGLIGGWGYMNINITGAPVVPGNGEPGNGEPDNGEPGNGEPPENGGNGKPGGIIGSRQEPPPAAGAGNCDVAFIISDRGINSIYNDTPGGDIYDIYANGRINSVYVGESGAIGWLFDGSGVSWCDAHQVLDARYFPGGEFLATEGNINYVSTGYLCSDLLYTPGRLQYLVADGTFAHGIDFTNIVAEQGIGVIATHSSVNWVTISTLVTDPVDGGLSGGYIQTIRAGSMNYVDIESFSGIGTLYAFTGIFGTDIITYHWDPVLGDYVGGGIHLMNVGGMWSSGVESLGRVGSLSIGTEGMTGSSALILHDGVGVIWNQGQLGESSAIIVEGNASYINISTNIADFSLLEVDGYLGSLVVGKAITSDSSVVIDGNVGVVRIGGRDPLDPGGITDGGELIIDGRAGFITLGRGDDGTIEVDGNLGMLYSMGEFVDTTVDVDGNANVLIFLSGPQDSDFNVGGNLGFMYVRGNFTGSSLDVDGNANLFMTSGSVTDLSGIYVDGTLGSMLVMGGLIETDVWAADGINLLMVRGSIDNSIIDVSDYDGLGDPVGGGIRTIYALGEMVSTDILSQSGIGTLLVIGDITDSYITTTAYDNFGFGSLVGGGGIGALRAAALIDSTVESFGTIGYVTLGLGGMDATSWLGTLDASGDLLRLHTTGLVFGEINVAGDVGSILTAGQNAIPGTLPFDYLFVDQAGVPTGGTLEVAGSITGLIS